LVLFLHKKTIIDIVMIFLHSRKKYYFTIVQSLRVISSIGFALPLPLDRKMFLKKRFFKNIFNVS